MNLILTLACLFLGLGWAYNVQILRQRLKIAEDRIKHLTETLKSSFAHKVYQTYQRVKKENELLKEELHRRNPMDWPKEESLEARFERLKGHPYAEEATPAPKPIDRADVTKLIKVIQRLVDGNNLSEDEDIIACNAINSFITKYPEA